MTPDAPDMLAVARNLLARGFSVIPLDHPEDTWVTDPNSVGKTAAIKWTPFQKTLPTDADLIEWFGNGHKRNAAIVTGKVSNIVVVDGDSVEALAWMHAHLPPTPMRTQTARGEHWGYRHPGVSVKNKVRINTSDPAIKIDVRGDGGYVVAIGSVHASGITYLPIGTWPSVNELPAFDPTWLGPDASTKLPPSIPRGQQHKTLFHEGCRLRRLGWEKVEIADALWSLHKHRSEGPNVKHEQDDVEKIAADICDRYTPAIDTFPLTEAGDAEFFARIYADSVRHDHRQDRWLILDERSGIWLPDGTGRITTLAIDAVRLRQTIATTITDSDKRQKALAWNRSESRARLTNLQAIAKDLAPITDAGDRWDTISHLLGTPDGVVDLRTGDLRRAQPDECVTMRTSVAYDPDAQSELWQRTLATIFPDATERAFLQVALGYSATGEMNLDKWFLPNGEKGRNGKGTLLGATGSALGDYAMEIDASTFDKRVTTAYNLAQLPGKRFVHCSEAGNTTTLHHERLKQVTGGDSLRAGDKYQRAFQFAPCCKLWFACNDRPRVTDESAAFWARVIVVLFQQTFLGKEDTSIRDALRHDPTHQGAVLRWIIEGAIRFYRQKGLGALPPAFVNATTEFQRENERITEFLDQCCIESLTAVTKGSELWEAYRAWGKQTSVREPLGAKTFYQALAKRFTKGRDGYVGVGLLVAASR
jgi:putative DNA primase/helicase